MNEAEAKTADRSFFEEMRREERRFAVVPVDEWDASIKLERLKGPELLRLVDIWKAAKQDEGGRFENFAESMHFAVEICALSIVDDDGRPFDDDAGREFLMRQDISALQTIMSAALDLNGLVDIEVDIDGRKKK